MRAEGFVEHADYMPSRFRDADYGVYLYHNESILRLNSLTKPGSLVLSLFSDCLLAQ